MASSFWKTKAPSGRRERITWPSLFQLVGQVGVVLVVGLVWGGLLFGFLRLTESPAGTTPPPEATEAAAVGPVESPTPPPPTDSPEAAPSPLPSPTLETAAEIITATAVSEIQASEPSPTPVVTATTVPPTPEAAAPEPPAAEPVTETDAEVSFAQEVMPILDRRCIKCHGGERTEEGLVLKTHADILAGSWNGPVVEPGDVENSFLIEQIVTGEMPDKGPRLLPAEIRIIEAWVAAGAPDN